MSAETDAALRAEWRKHDEYMRFSGELECSAVRANGEIHNVAMPEGSAFGMGFWAGFITAEVIGWR